MNIRIIFLVLLLFIFALIFISWYFNKEIQNTVGNTKLSNAAITYVPIGDSYTIGYDVNENDRWPNVLVNNLKKEGINISLVSNPAVSGFTVRDATYFELPEIEEIKPDFVTVLIGANDSFGQRDINIFEKDLIELLDKLEEILPTPKNIVLITIPDYSISLQTEGFDKKSLSKSIEEYNRVIKDQAQKRKLRVADIFPISKTMTQASDYTQDGLHPSSLGYLKWEKVIFPVVFKLLKNR